MHKWPKQEDWSEVQKQRLDKLLKNKPRPRYELDYIAAQSGRRNSDKPSHMSR